MTQEIRTSKLTKIVLGAGIVLLGIIIFLQQAHVSFMLEDMDYLENLETKGAIASLRDILQSQAWLFRNRGGSILAQTVLQIILVLGERAADVLNTGAMLGVSLLICLTIGANRQRFFFVAFPFFLLISTNSEWLESYFWQFGTVNYFYPAVFLLLFLRAFCMLLEERQDESSVWGGVLLALCGFCAGLWNGSYGLLCVGIAGIGMFLNRHLLGRRVKRRMVAGLCGALFGMVCYLATPGNYHADSVMASDYLMFSIYPAVILALTMLAILLRIGGWLDISQILMVGALGWAVILSFVLSWIPRIATNGIQLGAVVLGITCFCSLYYHVNLLNPRHRKYGYVLAAITFLVDAVLIVEKMNGVN